MSIACLVYDGVDALEAAVFAECLSALRAQRFHFVGSERRIFRSNAGLGIRATRSLSELVTPTILIVPGGSVNLANFDESVLGWLRGAHASARFSVGSGCGARVLHAAGVKPRWAELDAASGAPAEPRVRRSDTLFLGAGATGALDLVLWLIRAAAGERWAKTVQLAIEYDPERAPSSHARERRLSR